MGLPFKERLLAFKARHFLKKLPKVEKPINSRLGDIVRPLLQVLKVVKPENEELFLSFIKEIRKDQVSKKSECKEGRMLTIINELINTNDYVDGCIIRISEITEKYNENVPYERFKISDRRIGIITRSLGLLKGKDRSGAFVIFEPDNFYPICSNYGIEITSERYNQSQTMDTGEESHHTHHTHQNTNDCSGLSCDDMLDDILKGANLSQDQNGHNQPISLNILENGEDCEDCDEFSYQFEEDWKDKGFKDPND